MLRDIHIGKTFLHAASSDLLKELYLPALKESCLYERGTAFFSIGLLLSLMDSLVEFVYHGGEMRLLTSVELDDATLLSFAEGYALSDEDIAARLQDVLQDYLSIAKEKTHDEEARLDVLANMIAAGRLKIKVATAARGIYHEKIGVFTDSNGDSIAFYGSANETVNAFYNNYETLAIFPSWGGTSALAEEYKAHFARLWANEESGVRVVDFPDAVAEELVRMFRRSPSLADAIKRLIEIRGDSLLEKATPRRLHAYQEKAVEEFVKNGYRHLYAMATGTGKTFTAVKSIERMAKTFRYLNVVVLVPLVDLQRQWESAIETDLALPHRIYKYGGCGRDEKISYRMSTMTASSQNRIFVSIAICVYDTFFSTRSEDLKALKGDTLLLVDEMHNLTMGNVDVLNRVFKYRLGLSATPQRFRQNETRRIQQLFLNEDAAPYCFTLEQAIEAGFLSRYKYYPIEVELTPEELDGYAKASKKIATLVALCEKEPNKENQKLLEDALIARSRIVKKAENKIHLLRDMIESSRYDFHNAVVFCGPGRLGLDGDEKGERIVDLVTRTIGRNPINSYFPAKYTSGEDDRPSRLENFTKRYADTLVAVKCFDEGLDVPALDKIYIMASDSSLRQTIQRRGRVLRLSKDTGKEIAFVYDMVAGERINDVFCPLSCELPRVHEYSRISENPEDSEALLRGFDSSNGNSFDGLENNE